MNNDLKIDVVLTAYKKVDALQQQIDAINNQTYKINKMYLFKDGIDSYYDIVLREAILAQFDGVKISDINVGVWGRFEYACNECEADLVCIFDDDTIPGSRWIENCVNSFMEKPGVYGTNGIIIKEAGKYPYDMYHVGWHNPNKETTKVDFVGHSWFVKKEWLKWMLELKEKNVNKYVGEDMALSFACQRHGIFTYVPMHPYNDVRFWGSKPTEGEHLGTQGVAISLNASHLEAMNKAIVCMKEQGWSFLLEKDCNYIKKIKDVFETEKDKKKIIEQDLLGFIDTSTDVYLYGAGKYGIEFYRYFTSHKKIIKGFVVTELNSTSIDVDGQKVQIISLEQLNKLEKATVILSLNSIFHASIRNKIDNRISVYCEKDKTYCYKDIIDVVINN